MTFPATRRRPQAGFTLVELLVALVLSMILAIVLLKMQGTLGQQRARTSDIAERDNEVRAALNMITQDMSGTAYLFGNETQPCDVLLTYNGTVTARYFSHHVVDGVAAANGAVMNFATNLTLNYPTDTTPSDVLVITASNDSSNFYDATSQVMQGNPNPTIGTAPTSTGVIELLPPRPNNAALQAGHQAVVLAPFPPATGATRGMNACMRVPLVTNPSANVYTTATSPLMPPTFFAGFQPSLTANGFGTLGDGELFVAKVTDAGTAAAPTQTTTAFYVDNNGGSYPILMRAQYSMIDDTPIGTPQMVAAGVVSLQARFKVAGGSYLTAAQVTASQAWTQVCSVRVAIVSRSINNDPDPNYVWTPTLLTPGTASTVSPGAPFSDVPVPSTMTNRRYLLQQTELAVRNMMWSNGSIPC